MNEQLLHYIWQHRCYSSSTLLTTAGEPVEVRFPGHYNHDQGPDFSDARIRIGDTEWAGMVEIHVRHSDWRRHGHDDDANYRNVILHVVWTDDGGGDAGTQQAPVLELQGRVPRHLLQRYEQIMNASSFIPCEKLIGQVPPLTWSGWKERLVTERLTRRAAQLLDMFQGSGSHWEEVFWWLLARHFGNRVNAAAFEEIARSVPLTVLAKHKRQLVQLEALLMGQAGLLEAEFREDYPVLLQREYRFLRAKYGLMPIAGPVHFLRMRPGNFPTIRLAQLAALIHRSDHLFSRILEAGTVKEVSGLLEATANDYWHYHYTFDQPSPFRQKRLGPSMTGILIINTIVPALFAYGQYHGNRALQDKGIRWLRDLAPESNVVTRGFSLCGMEAKNAFDSQALLELRKEYCAVKRCLDCAVGVWLLKGEGSAQ